jgi:hypothetical protein
MVFERRLSPNDLPVWKELGYHMTHQKYTLGVCKKDVLRANQGRASNQGQTAALLIQKNGSRNGNENSCLELNPT